MLLRAIDRNVLLIKANPHYGLIVSKKLIPREYMLKYNATNLFRVTLPDFWRMLYTLAGGGTEIEIVAFVLDVVDHRDYDRKFGYKKR